MYAFEATQSVPRTGTGSRREGEKFEHLVATFWEALGDYLKDDGAESEVVSGLHKRSGKTWRFMDPFIRWQTDPSTSRQAQIALNRRQNHRLDGLT